MANAKRSAGDDAAGLATRDASTRLSVALSSPKGDEREYRECVNEQQRRQPGCSASRMQLGVHHGLPVRCRPVAARPSSDRDVHIDFSGQTALVTGATRGIGRQVAEDLLRLGARLILTGTKPDEIDRLNAQARDGETYLCADFSERDSLRDFLAALARHERIDVCVNNAGINRVDAVDEIQDDDLDAVIDVNLRAPILITRTVARLMKRHRYGRIVNISSIWGHISWTKRAAYASTKFAIRGLTVASSNDLAQDNILVNAVSPGFTLTTMVQQNYSEAERQRIEAQIPLRRMAAPDEISRVVLFLASNLNTYITGQSVIVDGGYCNT